MTNTRVGKTARLQGWALTVQNLQDEMDNSSKALARANKQRFKAHSRRDEKAMKKHDAEVGRLTMAHQQLTFRLEAAQKSLRESLQAIDAFGYSTP